MQWAKTEPCPYKYVPADHNTQKEGDTKALT